MKENINQAVCRWCYAVDLETLCVTAKKIGLKAIDLVGPDDWPVLQKHGLHSSMCNGAEISIEKGWNDIANHPTLIKNYSSMIPLVAGSGYSNLICFSGNRSGMDDETAIRNCVEGLKQVLTLAENHGVILVMELLNSIVDHPDYHCNKTEWGVELAKRLDSPSFKLLYDIYHMQVEEGNIISTIEKYHPYIAHYHTAGVPGRHEIDNTQELYYPAIMRAIKGTGFTGYIAHEFIARKADPFESLQDAVAICDQ